MESKKKGKGWKPSLCGYTSLRPRILHKCMGTLSANYHLRQRNSLNERGQQLFGGQRSCCWNFSATSAMHGRLWKTANCYFFCRKIFPDGKRSCKIRKLAELRGMAIWGDGLIPVKFLEQLESIATEGSRSFLIRVYARIFPLPRPGENPCLHCSTFHAPVPVNSASPSPLFYFRSPLDRLLSRAHRKILPRQELETKDYYYYYFPFFRSLSNPRFRQIQPRNYDSQYNRNIRVCETSLSISISEIVRVTNFIYRLTSSTLASFDILFDNVTHRVGKQFLFSLIKHQKYKENLFY